MHPPLPPHHAGARTHARTHARAPTHRSSNMRSNSRASTTRPPTATAMPQSWRVCETRAQRVRRAACRRPDTPVRHPRPGWALLRACWCRLRTRVRVWATRVCVGNSQCTQWRVRRQLDGRGRPCVHGLRPAKGRALSFPLVADTRYK
jgi:hypothetical protein